MSNLIMPKVDRKLIARRGQIVKELANIINSKNILHHEDEIRPFETDALSASSTLHYKKMAIRDLKAYYSHIPNQLNEQ